MSKLADIGQAQHQPVSIEVVSGTVEELEREIDRLQKQNEELRRDVQRLQTWHTNQQSMLAEKDETIQAQSERIGDLVADVWRLESEIAQLQEQNENQATAIRVLTETVGRLEANAEAVADTAWTMATRFHLDWAEKTLHLIAARCGAMYKYDALRLVLETVKEAHAEIAKRREILPPQNPVICPVEPPVPTLTANVPQEAVGVHAAPNVRIAGGE